MKIRTGVVYQTATNSVDALKSVFEKGNGTRNSTASGNYLVLYNFVDSLYWF
jgi:hypothetical protein